MMSENIITQQELMDKAREVFDLGNREESAKLYEEAYRMKKNGVCAFQVFVWYISQSDYEKACYWLMELDNFNEYKNDFYTYALLLNNFVNLSEELISRLNNLEIRDLRLDRSDLRFEDRDLNNRIRDAILSERYNVAYGLINRIINTGSSQPQEYVIYRLLREKEQKEPKRIKKMITEERFDDLYDFLNTKPNYQKKDELAMHVLKDIYDMLDGIIIKKAKKASVRLTDAIYNSDYSTALELCHNDIVLESLLKKAIEINQDNIVSKYNGDLGYYFYDTCEAIYFALKNKNYDFVKDKIKEYIGVIGQVCYNNYLMCMVEVYKLMPEYESDLLNLLSDVTYGHKVIDTVYLKKLFGIALNEHRYEAAESLLHTFEYMREITDINVEYMRFVYNRELYLNKDISYGEQESDNLLVARINDLLKEQSNDSQIKTLEANNLHEEFVIKYTLKNIDSCFYRIGDSEFPTSFYIKKKKFTSKEFKRDIAVTKISTCIKKGNYEDALETVKNGLAYSKEFDYVLLSYASYLYDLMGNEERLEYINSILLNVFGIEDYRDIINSDEVALLDNSIKMKEFVKKLINKPIE